MIELEIYAKDVRNSENILALERELEAIPGLRYKVDRNHDIVYLEADKADFTLKEIRAIFQQLGLQARIVGRVPEALRGDTKKRTQPLA